MDFTNLFAPPQGVVASTALTVSLAWQRWPRVAFSRPLATAEMCTELGQAVLFCSYTIHLESPLE